MEQLKAFIEDNVYLFVIDTSIPPYAFQKFYSTISTLKEK